jgi:hypothetical protein
MQNSGITCSRLGVERLRALHVREVDDGVAAAHRLGHVVGKADVPGDHMAVDALQPHRVAAAHVVQDADLVPVGGQALNQVAADEAGAAGYQDLHPLNSHPTGNSIL